MIFSRRVRHRIGALGLLGALLASCSSGAPPAAKSIAAHPPAAGSTSTSTSAATIASPAPAVKSDEAQIRDALFAFQEAYNTRNWDAYLTLMCQSMREQFTAPAMAVLKRTREENGLNNLAIKTISVDGDTASVLTDAKAERVLQPQTISFRLARDNDRWTICLY